MQNVCCEIGTKIKGKMEPLILLITVAIVGALSVATAEESVLTLDHSNFTQVVSKHDFIVVEFYAPWCGHCKNLAPEYEKAAQELSNHDPPIVLAKIDVDDESNRDIATEFNIQGFPTIKILRNGGKSSQEYNGPREADGIVYYLKKQLGPASDEIKSVEDAASLINENSVFIVGVFPKFSGKEFENFMTLAEKLRSDFPFGHTLDAKHLLDPKHLPRGRAVSKPTLRLLKPFDELYVDFEDLQVDAMEKFIQESSIPTITTWNNDPINQEYLGKFFDSSDDKAMLFVNFTEEHDSFHPIYKEVAASYKGKGIRFLLGDVDLAQNAFGYFGLKPEDAPALVIDTVKGEKYLKPSVEPKEIAQWVKDYKDGLLKPFIKSQPIPEVNDEPVKVVVHDSLQDVVFSSGKNVLMEFYAPWCGHCKKLAPILDEVATSFANDPEILIAKYDAEANDVPSGTFDVKGFPTLYFKSASGKLSLYDGERTKEGIIDFIQKNRDNPPQLSSAKSGTVEADSLKDEL